MNIDKDIVNLLKDIKKQNDKIIKSLKNIENGVNELNGYVIEEDGEND